ncbi:hypothetical protein SH668x_003209 [Planctomicrobium sp. SH668]|uniref:hypothetical protein n=1 Tax=Planctomicrobium sp. SH668 TaxID=3448126 RepID=UPI003F5B5DF9
MSTTQYPNSPEEFLSQNGFYTDTAWAKAVGDVEPKTLRKKVQDAEIPIIKWGDWSLIHADDVLGYLSNQRSNTSEKPKTK